MNGVEGERLRDGVDWVRRYVPQPVRLLSLDYDPTYEPATRAEFRGDDSVFDFDVVIWDPSNSLLEYIYSGSTGLRNLRSLSEGNSVSIQADAKRRRAEFLEFLEAGRILVAFAAPPLEVFVHKGENAPSARNLLLSEDVKEFDLWGALPLSTIEFQRASGTEIEITTDGPIGDLLRKYRKFMRYSAVIRESKGTAVAKVSGTNRVLGCAMKVKGGGMLLLLPPLDFPSEETDDDDAEETDIRWGPEAAEFQEDLIETLNRLDEGAVAELPEWAQHYATEPLRDLNQKVLAQQKKVENARSRLTKYQGQRQELEEHAQLYLGTGRALELQVRSAFELLGGKVDSPLAGRDDWRVTFPEGDAVLEVKGVKKSAAEKHAAQLEKWVAGVYEETGRMPKGILVANTWREKPLASRKDDDFPQQMLPYCEGRGHCLLTGLQLFLIRADVEKHPRNASRWRKTLLATNGILSDPTDWRDAIVETATEVDSSSA